MNALSEMTTHVFLALIANAGLPVRISVCLSVRHTDDAPLNGSRYRNIFHPTHGLSIGTMTFDLG